MIYKFKKVLIIFVVLVLGNTTIVFPLYGNNSPNYSISNEKYVVDDRGNILMHVNILGHVKNPGYHLVHEGIDIITVISVAGGYLPGANLKKITLIRESTDENNKIIHIFDLKEFYKSGERENLVKILPNDTIVIEETIFSSIFKGSNTLVSILQLLNIYLQISSD